ncbi:hypothetical protein [Saccharothrix deserti]|uniref:hypothetical protein n=1 Tax=Saccharothrix deserti TaxID=2593674 RepID=UPI00131AE5D0|nr:hypothetical protein [Saccharothrix deserti]
MERPVRACARTGLRRLEGVFRRRTAWPRRPVTLIGFEPRGPLVAAFRVGREPAPLDVAQLRPGGGSGNGWCLDLDITGIRPSGLGEGLFDVDVRNGVPRPSSPDVKPVWDLWYAGGPDVPNLWASYSTGIRWEWVDVAMSHHDPAPPPASPPGHVVHLDGRYVTDLAGFHCAIGEAVNGPAATTVANSTGCPGCSAGSVRSRRSPWSGTTTTWRADTSRWRASGRCPGATGSSRSSMCRGRTGSRSGWSEAHATFGAARIPM